MITSNLTQLLESDVVRSSVHHNTMQHHLNISEQVLSEINFFWVWDEIEGAVSNILDWPNFTVQYHHEISGHQYR